MGRGVEPTNTLPKSLAMVKGMFEVLFGSFGQIIGECFGTNLMIPVLMMSFDNIRYTNCLALLSEFY